MKRITKFIAIGITFAAIIFPFTTEQLSTTQQNTYLNTPQIKNTSGVINSINNTKPYLNTTLSIQSIEIPTVTKSLIKELNIQTAQMAENAAEVLYETEEKMEKAKKEQLEKYDTYISKEYVEYAKEIVQNYPNLKLSLVIAVIECESSGRPNVVSKAGAVGLMQIIPKWATDKMTKFGVSSLYDPYGNILIGCDMLSEHLTKYNGNEYAALMRYNGTKNPAQKAAEGNYSAYSIKVVDRAKQLELIYD